MYAAPTPLYKRNEHFPVFPRAELGGVSGRSSCRPVAFILVAGPVNIIYKPAENSRGDDVNVWVRVNGNIIVITVREVRGRK